MMTTGSRPNKGPKMSILVRTWHEIYLGQFMSCPALGREEEKVEPFCRSRKKSNFLDGKRQLAPPSHPKAGERTGPILQTESRKLSVLAANAATSAAAPTSRKYISNWQNFRKFNFRSLVKIGQIERFHQMHTFQGTRGQVCQFCTLCLSRPAASHRGKMMEENTFLLKKTARREFHKDTHFGSCSSFYCGSQKFQINSYDGFPLVFNNWNSKVFWSLLCLAKTMNGSNNQDIVAHFIRFLHYWIHGAIQLQYALLSQGARTHYYQRVEKKLGIIFCWPLTTFKGFSSRSLAKLFFLAFKVCEIRYFRDDYVSKVNNCSYWKRGVSQCTSSTTQYQKIDFLIDPGKTAAGGRRLEAT